MKDKKEFEISLIEESEERVVEASIEEVPQQNEGAFQVEEIKEEDELKQEEGLISKGNIKANLVAKKPVKEYVYGSVFIALAIGTLIVGFLVDGYMVVGIICCVLASMAGYSMFNTIFEAKKIQRLLDDGSCTTVEQLMVALKKKKKYDFLRNLGGIIRAGYVVGYEIVNDNEIRKVN